MCKEFNYTKFTGSLPSKSSLRKESTRNPSCSKKDWGRKSVEKGIVNKEHSNKLVALYTLKMLRVDWNEWKSSLQNSISKISFSFHNYWLYTLNFYFTWNILTSNKQNYRTVNREYINSTYTSWEWGSDSTVKAWKSQEFRNTELQKTRDIKADINF